MKKTLCSLAVLLASVVLSEAFAGYFPAYLSIPFVSESPSVDQVSLPEAPFWRSGVGIYGMTEWNRGREPKWNSSASFAANQDYLYVQICATKDPEVALTASETKRDGKIYFDDCLELALALPGAPAGNYYQFSVNAANVLYDARNVDASWNSNLTSKVVVEDERWIATFRIPFADLGFSTQPETLQCNISRTTLAPASEQSVMVRSDTNLFFGNLAKAITLRFGQGIPAGSFQLLLEDEQEGVLRASALTLPPEKFADFQVKITDEKNHEVFSGKGQSRFDSLQTDIEWPHLEDGKYLCHVQMLQARKNIIPAYYGGGVEDNPRLKDGQEPEVYLDWHWPMTVDNAPKLLVAVKLLQEGRTLCASLTPQSFDYSDEAHYRLVICDEKGKVLKELPSFKCDSQNRPFSADISFLPPRSRFILKAELWQDEACRLSAECRFATPPVPEWKHAGLAVPPDPQVVPEPWIPVELNALETSCWGRKFQFSKDSPVPVQIVSQKIPMLEAPVRIVSEPKISWKLSKAVRQNPSCVRYDYTGRTADGKKLSAFTEVYFDGVVRTDMTLPENAVFKTLYLEIPVKRDVAEFSHHGPGQFGGMFNIRKCVEKEEYPLIPNVMLLNDEVGLGWFDGMSFDWPLADARKTVQVLPDEKKAVMRIHYVDQAKSYPRSRTFSWGLQAFPVKPMPEKEDGMRMSYSIRYGDEARTAWFSTVDYVARGNILLEQGAMECKFRIPKSSEEEPLLLVAHGDAAQARLFVDKNGILVAQGTHYGAFQWMLKSKDPVSPEIWHQLGLNWGNGKIELWLDGRPVASQAAEKLMRIFPTRISAGGLHCSLDELRVSDCPRESFSMEKPVVDEHTLLCDCFERQGYVNGRRATLPEKIADDAEAGYLLPDTRLEKGVRGDGIGPLRVPLKSVVQGYAAMGFKMMCYHASQYTDEAFSGLYIKNEKAFRSSVKAIHDAGMRAIIYTGNGISTFDRSWDTYADPWLIEPRGVPFVQSWIPDEKGYQACPRSGFTDYFFWRIGELMDTYGIDGIFLDGRMSAQCSNAGHGCAVTNFDGQTVSKRDPWDSRWRSQVLYNVVQSRHGYAEQHKSGNWNIPDCFYWNGVWEGEQLMGVQLNGRRRLDVCPLESMRGEINGMPFGMPSRNTAYTMSPFTSVENCTYSFVHGTTWTMTYRPEEGLVVSPYWLAMDRFGATFRNFRGYWSKNPPAKSTCHELVKVSAHVKPKEVLLIVANFNEDAPRTSGEITLDLKGLGLKHPQMTDAFSGEKISLSKEGTFRVDIKSFRQAWYLLKE